MARTAFSKEDQCTTLPTRLVFPLGLATHRGTSSLAAVLSTKSRVVPAGEIAHKRTNMSSLLFVFCRQERYCRLRITHSVCVRAALRLRIRSAHKHVHKNCAHSGKVHEQTATKSISAFKPLSHTTASQLRSYLRKNTNACTPVRLAVDDLNKAFPLRVDLARSSGVTGSVPSLEGAALGRGVAMADAVESSPTDEQPRVRGTRDGDPAQRTCEHVARPLQNVHHA